MIEKTVIIKGLVVNYKSAGNGQPLLILHGWASSSNSWVKIQSALAEKGYKVISVDMPGFGKTNAPLTVWGIDEYSTFVLDFANKLKLDTFVLLGHSYGGQTAVKFVSDNPDRVTKLILVAPSVIRKKKGVGNKGIMYFTKTVKLLIPFGKDFAAKVLYKVLRKGDYLRAQGIMKEIFKKVISQDMFSLLPSIRVNTLLIWGSKDDMVSVEDGRLMQDAMPNADLKIISGAKHSPNLTNTEQVTDIIERFI